MSEEIIPGARVLVYDAWANGWTGYIKGNGEYRPARVIARYGMQTKYGRYPDLVDVVFDCGREGKSHFTDCVFGPNLAQSKKRATQNVT